jgi:hypothetical protein
MNAVFSATIMSSAIAVAGEPIEPIKPPVIKNSGMVELGKKPDFKLTILPPSTNDTPKPKPFG